MGIFNAHLYNDYENGAEKHRRKEEVQMNKFEQAKQRRHEQKAQEEARKNGSSGGDFEEIPYNALVTNGWKGVRLLGDPIDDDDRKPTDGKLVFSSMILGDNQKKFRVTWDSNQNWILWRIMNLVMAGKYNTTTKSRDYFNASKCPSIFNRVANNDNPTNPYESGWYPSKSVVMNHIDLSDLQFHLDTGSAKILSKKMTPPKAGQDRTFFERGFPLSLYESIIDDIVEYKDGWEDYNIAIKKTKENPYYTVKHQDSSDLEMMLAKEDPELLRLIKDPAITHQVESLVDTVNLIDIDKITKITTYTKIKNRLGNFIKEVDRFFNKNFYAELEEECKKEQAQWEAEGKTTPNAGANNTTINNTTTSNTVVHSPQYDTNVENSVVQAEETVTSQPAVAEAPIRGRQPVQEAPALDLTGLSSAYMGIGSLTQAELDLIQGVGADGELTFKPQTASGEAVALYKCSCDALSPGQYETCPKCGSKFQQ